MAFVTFEIDDPDKELREQAKISARRKGTTVSAILRDCFLALARGEESGSTDREVALAPAIGQGATSVEAKLSTPAESTQSRTREHATERTSNGNGHRQLTTCSVCLGSKTFRDSISREERACWKCGGKGTAL